jgi:hypothetical protein
VSGVVLDVLGPGPIEHYCTCGRRLLRPDSIARGQGPVCWDKTHPTRLRLRRRAVMAAPAPRRPDPGDGQLELDITTTAPGGRV